MSKATAKVMTKLIAIAPAAAILALVPIFAQAGDVAAGRTKAATCQACHGADGNSQTAQFPRLAGQHADYLIHALEGYTNGTRKNAIMAGLAAALTKEDRENLAAFYASQDGTLHTVNFEQ